MKNCIFKKGKTLGSSAYKHEIEYYLSIGMLKPSDLKKFEKKGFFKLCSAKQEPSVQEIVENAHKSGFIDVNYMLNEIDKAQKELSKCQRRGSSKSYMAPYYAERLSQIDLGFSKLLREEATEFTNYFSAKKMGDVMFSDQKNEKIPFSKFEDPAEGYEDEDDIEVETNDLKTQYDD